MVELSPHPVTGQLFTSPVPAGTGWPGDPAQADTAVASSPDEVVGLASRANSVEDLQALISVCTACPRLVRWREVVATTGRRAAFAGQPYWGRPGPSFGDPHAPVLIVGLAPAANGTNRTGRMFTGDASGDFLYAALYRTGWAAQPTSVAAGDGQRLIGMRILAAVRCAPPQNKPTGTERASCAGWLRRDLALTRELRTVLCLGGLAWNAVLGAARELGWTVPRPKPKFGHGVRTFLGAPHGSVALVGSYHVSPHNTYTGRLTVKMLDEVLASLRT